MSYQVLARKWRPRNFDELSGQEHVVRPLVNALAEGRLHHAFLFAGTRGIGKTTIARIFAKALNCEQGVSAIPCGQCSTCTSIDEGRYVDLIEVDAASRTKVEDTRDLLENVQYAPTRGRYKVYLIDEVHMLSNHSFNALLKTLEEPPPYVKFLLATTDPQRLPITVLSRCLQFKLKSLPSATIGAQLEMILGRENIAFEKPALSAIARAAQGSMRDALSLLDQAIAYGGGQVQSAAVDDMLGLIDQRYTVRLLDALAAKDAKALLACVAEFDRDAPDYAAMLGDLLSWLQRIALLQAVEDAIDEQHEDSQTLRRFAGSFSREDVQLYYQIALIGRRDLDLAPEPRGGFEMVLLRMLCFTPAIPDQALKQTIAPAASPSMKVAATVAATANAAPECSAKTTATAISTPAGPTPANTELNWDHLVDQLRLTGMTRQLALHCAVTGFVDKTLHLQLDPANAKVRTDNTEQRLKQILIDHFGYPIKLNIELAASTAITPAQAQAEQLETRRQAAVDALQQDPNIQALQTTFDARLQVDSIKATD